MSTLQQIRSQCRILIGEEDTANTHIDDITLNSFINQAQKFVATLIEHPRDFAEINTQEGFATYTLPTDVVLIRTAYFGDINSSGDIEPLIILSEETLKEINPNWLDETVTSRGRPKYLIMLNKRQILVNPTPNAEESTSSKKISINYVYVPASMSADGEVPEIPLPYHDILQFYVAHLAYLGGKLNNPVLSQAMLNNFTDKVKALIPAVTKETKEGMAFQWGYDEVNGGDVGGVTP